MTQEIVGLVAHLTVHPGISADEYGESKDDVAIHCATYSSYLGNWIERMERLFLVELAGIKLRSATFSVEGKVPTISTTVEFSAKRCPHVVEAVEKWLLSLPDSDSPSSDELTQEQFRIAERPMLRELESILALEFAKNGFLVDIRTSDLQTKTQTSEAK